MSLAVSNLTCPEGIQFILHSSIFGNQCVTTPMEVASVIIGFSSMICWLFSQGPQVIKSWKTGTSDQAFSPWFLMEWFLGDIFNLTGAILAHQLSFQIWQAAYFCLMDTIISSQYLFARLRTVYVKRKHGSTSPVNFPTLPIICCLLAVGPVHMFLNSGSSSTAFDYTTSSLRGGGRTLLASSKKHDGDSSFEVFLPSVSKDALYGYILGSISAVFYIFAGFPQIVKNYKRKSCEGLSIAMFVLAALGNLTYALGILLFSVDHMFLLNKLPWLAGSLGSLIYQFTALSQFYIYRKGSPYAASPDGERQHLMTNDYALPVDYNRIAV